MSEPMLAWCTEPDGRVEVPGVGIPAHDVMLDEQGYCPWCGAEEG